jgi:hypothetical protein
VRIEQVFDYLGRGTLAFYYAVVREFPQSVVANIELEVLYVDLNNFGFILVVRVRDFYIGRER